MAAQCMLTVNIKNNLKSTKALVKHYIKYNKTDIKCNTILQMKNVTRILKSR